MNAFLQCPEGNNGTFPVSLFCSNAHGLAGLAFHLRMRHSAGPSGRCNPRQTLLECSDLPIDARIAKDPSGAERRDQPRSAVELDAHVREMGTTGTEARVLNISRDGFMAEISTEHEVGARVWLILPGRERASAIVRWIAAGKLGAQFAEPLSDEALAQIGGGRA